MVFKRDSFTLPGQTFNETINAFLTANKEGFHLADVNAAPLAQRRRRKANTTTSDTSSAPGATSSGTTTGDSGDGGKGNDSRKRKLFAVPEEVDSVTHVSFIHQAATRDSDTTMRPSTLELDNGQGMEMATPTSAEFTTYRNPQAASLRHTRETKEK